MSSPSAAALVRTASEEERERKQQAEAKIISSLVEVREAETELADVQQQILALSALSPREEGESAASTPTGAERSADASPRFSYANNHSSGRQHVRGSGVARSELLQLARDGTLALWGDTMIRTDARARSREPERRAHGADSQDSHSELQRAAGWPDNRNWRYVQ